MSKFELDFSKTIEDSIAVKQAMLGQSALLHTLGQVAQRLVEASSQRKRVFFAGNGGSAADAQHLAAEFVSRFEFDRPGLPAMALSTDTSMLTAIGNDYGFEKLFARQLEAQANEGDVFVGITTSGRSKNILKAFERCKALGVTSVALCGQGGELEELVDYVVRVPSSHTARIQESHILIGHMWCSAVERAVFADLAPKSP
jgi:D-sedoheptulose 7-phosphate isomerase